MSKSPELRQHLYVLRVNVNHSSKEKIKSDSCRALLSVHNQIFRHLNLYCYLENDTIISLFPYILIYFLVVICPNFLIFSLFTENYIQNSFSKIKKKTFLYLSVMIFLLVICQYFTHVDVCFCLLAKYLKIARQI